MTIMTRKNWQRLFVLCLVCLVGFSALPAFADSWVVKGINYAASSIISGIIFFVGGAVTLLIGLLIKIAAYNNFIYSPVVLKGWGLVRDISNMFFVLVMLIIAFGTILQQSQYQAQKLLPKVILMAVLVNFSKVIAGWFIDFSQVVMLTFVSAFQTIGAGNFAQALQINKVLTLDPAAQGVAQSSLSETTILASYLLGLVYVVVALIVILVMTVMLAIRIVVLWLLIIFSPLAYVLTVVPQGQQYASQWWSTFTKYLIFGPVMAFFLWLSLASFPVITTGFDIANTSLDPAANKLPSVGVIAAGTPEAMFTFIISISMLMAGLAFASKSGAAGAGFAGKAYSNLTTKGMSAVNGAQRLVTSPLRGIRYGATQAREAATGYITKKIVSGDSVLSAERFANTGFGVGRVAAGVYSRARGVQDKFEEEAKRSARRLSKSVPFARAELARGAITPKTQALHSELAKIAPRLLQQGTGPGSMQPVVEQLGKMKYEDFGSMDYNQHAIMAEGLSIEQAADPNFIRRNANNLRSYQFFLAARNQSKARTAVLHGQAIAGHTNLWNPAASNGAPGTPVLGDLQLSSGNSTPLTVAAVPTTTNAAGAVITAPLDYTKLQAGDVGVRQSQGMPANAMRASTVYLQGETVHVGQGQGIQFPSSAVSKVSGVKSLRPGSGTARLAVDFAAMGLQPDAYGANVADKNRPTMTKKIMDNLRAEGTYSEPELATMQQQLETAPQLHLMNKNAENPRGARHVIRHEAAHDRLDDLEEGTQEQLWQRIPEDQRTKIMADVNERWGGDMTENAAMEEYFAEGLANSQDSKTRERYEATQKAIQENGGDAEAFFASAAYGSKHDQYLEKKDFNLQLSDDTLHAFASKGVVKPTVVTRGDGSKATVYRMSDVARRGVAPTIADELAEEMMPTAAESSSTPRFTLADQQAERLGATRRAANVKPGMSQAEERAAMNEFYKSTVYGQQPGKYVDQQEYAAEQQRIDNAAMKSKVQGRVSAVASQAASVKANMDRKRLAPLMQETFGTTDTAAILKKMSPEVLQNMRDNDRADVLGIIKEDVTAKLGKDSPAAAEASAQIDELASTMKALLIDESTNAEQQKARQIMDTDAAASKFITQDRERLAATQKEAGVTTGMSPADEQRVMNEFFASEKYKNAPAARYTSQDDYEGLQQRAREGVIGDQQESVKSLLNKLSNALATPAAVKKTTAAATAKEPVMVETPAVASVAPTEETGEVVEASDHVAEPATARAEAAPPPATESVKATGTSSIFETTTLNPVLRKLFKDLAYEIKQLSKAQRLNTDMLAKYNGQLASLAAKAAGPTSEQPLEAKYQTQSIERGLQDLKKAIQASAGSETATPTNTDEPKTS